MRQREFVKISGKKGKFGGVRVALVEDGMVKLYRYIK